MPRTDLASVKAGLDVVRIGESKLSPQIRHQQRDRCQIFNHQQKIISATSALDPLYKVIDDSFNRLAFYLSRPGMKSVDACVCRPAT